MKRTNACNRHFASVDRCTKNWSAGCVLPRAKSVRTRPWIQKGGRYGMAQSRTDGITVAGWTHADDTSTRAPGPHMEIVKISSRRSCPYFTACARVETHSSRKGNTQSAVRTRKHLTDRSMHRVQGRVDDEIINQSNRYRKVRGAHGQRVQWRSMRVNVGLSIID